MSRLTIVVMCVLATVIHLMNSCEARHIEADDDLEVAASEWKKGEESDHHQSNYGKHGKKSEKGYDVKHGEEEKKKGHHDKKTEEGEYDEKKGHKKKHFDESGYHSKKEEGKKGEKGFKFYEEGKFRKGHSTKGSHVIHKLDESQKKKKFFDEDYDGAYDEKHSDFDEKHGSKKGGSHKKGHFNKSFAEKAGGKKGHGQHTKHHSNESGHKGSKGNESNYDHKSSTAKKGGSKKGTKYGHSKKSSH